MTKYWTTTRVGVHILILIHLSVLVLILMTKYWTTTIELQYSYSSRFVCTLSTDTHDKVLDYNYRAGIRYVNLGTQDVHTMHVLETLCGLTHVHTNFSRIRKISLFSKRKAF